MKRRVWLGGGIGAAAALAGIGTAWWHHTRSDERGLWSARFETLAGSTLALASLRGRPLLLNFWATWCAPCVEEMPQLDRFHRDFAASGWQVVGLALDGAAPVQEFLRRVPVGFAIVLAGMEGAELGRRLGNERGVLPFSVAFAADGRTLHQKAGATSYAELALWAKGAN